MSFLINPLSHNSFNGLWFIHCRAFPRIKRANPLRGHTGININMTYTKAAYQNCFHYYYSHKKLMLCYAYACDTPGSITVNRTALSVFLTPRTLNIKMESREISYFPLGEEIVCLDMATFQGYIFRTPSSRLWRIQWNREWSKFIFNNN